MYYSQLLTTILGYLTTMDTFLCKNVIHNKARIVDDFGYEYDIIIMPVGRTNDGRDKDLLVKTHSLDRPQVTIKG